MPDVPEYRAGKHFNHCQNEVTVKEERGEIDRSQILTGLGLKGPVLKGMVGRLAGTEKPESEEENPEKVGYEGSL